MTQKRALITGITGQDGSFLAEQLLAKGYQVFGLVRRCSTTNLSRIQHILDRITLIPGDLSDNQSLVRAAGESKPDEVYNLAAQSFVGVSWMVLDYTLDINALGCARLLEAIRLVKPDARFYQASTSEMFGAFGGLGHDESTPLRPRSPYGVSKVAAHWLTVNYRESYGMFTCCGILDNHESERRGMEFVTRKISYGVAQIVKGKADRIVLGNLDARRDWGYAPDYTNAMWQMLQQDDANDYVIATGVTHSVAEFAKAAFKAAGIDDWQKYILEEESQKRPVDIHALCGDASMAKAVLGWTPTTSFERMVKIMVQHDMETT